MLVEEKGEPIEMQKETVIYARDVLGANKPLKITLDNQHIYYDRMPMSCPLIWDDANERLYIVRTNQDNTISQANLPIETTVVDYDQIQQVACYDDLATVQSLSVLDLLTGDDKKKKFNEFLALNSTSRGVIPKYYKETKND